MATVSSSNDEDCRAIIQQYVQEQEQRDIASKTRRGVPIISRAAATIKPEELVYRFGKNLPSASSKQDFHERVKIYIRDRQKDPSLVQQFVWGCLDRFRSLVCVANEKGNGYLTAYVCHIVSSILSSRTGSQRSSASKGLPLALILVPTWKDVKNVVKICDDIIKDPSKLKVIGLFSCGSEQEQYSNLLLGCDILVATPAAFNRTIRGDFTRGGADNDWPNLFIRLDELQFAVFDQLEILLSMQKSEVESVLRALCNAASLKPKTGKQTIHCSFASKWTHEVRKFYRAQAVYNPILIVYPFSFVCWDVGIAPEVIVCEPPKAVSATPAASADPKERRAAIESARLASLKQKLFELGDKLKDRRTVICCTDSKLVEAVAKAVKAALPSIDAQTQLLVANDPISTERLTQLTERWLNCEQHQPLILVLHDRILFELGFKNADILIHYNLPSGESLYDASMFAYRSTLLKATIETWQKQKMTKLQTANIPSSFELPYISQELQQDHKKRQAQSTSFLPKVFLFVSPQDGRLLEDLTRFCTETNVAIPPQFKDRSANVKVLCPYLKRFGFCQNPGLCPMYRHSITHSMDKHASDVPTIGEAFLKITSVIGANHFTGRLTKLQTADGAFSTEPEDRYRRMERELEADQSCPASWRKVDPKTLKPGDCYLVKLWGASMSGSRVAQNYRVTNLSLAKPGANTIFVDFVDLGTSRQSVSISDVYALPEEFWHLPIAATPAVPAASASSCTAPATTPEAKSSRKKKQAKEPEKAPEAKAEVAAAVPAVKYPPFGITVIVAGLKPLDKDTDWTEHTTAFVRRKIENAGGVVRGRIKLALDRTIWLEPCITTRFTPQKSKWENGENITAMLVRKEREDAQAEANELHIKMLRALIGKTDKLWDKLDLPSHAEYANAEVKKNASPPRKSDARKKPANKKKQPEATTANVEVEEAAPIEPQLETLPEDQISKVSVTHVESPSLFYVQRLSKTDELDQLEADIKELVATRKVVPLPTSQMKVGEFCFAKNRKDWHRASIDQVRLSPQANGKSTVTVVFVDYGDLSDLDFVGAFCAELMTPDQSLFDRLPVQAIACRLPNLANRNGEAFQSEDCAEPLWQLTHPDKRTTLAKDNWFYAIPKPAAQSEELQTDNVVDDEATENEQANPNGDVQYELTLFDADCKRVDRRLIEAGLAVKKDVHDAVMMTSAAVGEDHVTEDSLKIRCLKSLLYSETNVDLTSAVQAGSLQKLLAQLDIPETSASTLLLILEILNRLLLAEKNKTSAKEAGAAFVCAIADHVLLTKPSARIIELCSTTQLENLEERLVLREYAQFIVNLLKAIQGQRETVYVCSTLASALLDLLIGLADKPYLVDADLIVSLLDIIATTGDASKFRMAEENGRESVVAFWDHVQIWLTIAWIFDGAGIWMSDQVYASLVLKALADASLALGQASPRVLKAQAEFLFVRNLILLEKNAVALGAIESVLRLIHFLLSEPNLKIQAQSTYLELPKTIQFLKDWVSEEITIYANSSSQRTMPEADATGVLKQPDVNIRIAVLLTELQEFIRLRSEEWQIERRKRVWASMAQELGEESSVTADVVDASCQTSPSLDPSAATTDLVNGVAEGVPQIAPITNGTEAKHIVRATALKQPPIGSKLPKLIPKEANSTKCPSVLWSQTMEAIALVVKLVDVGSIELHATNRTINFSTFLEAAQREYKFGLYLYKKINPTDVSYVILGPEVRITLVKSAPLEWPRLTKSKAKLGFIRLDHDRFKLLDPADDVVRDARSEALASLAEKDLDDVTLTGDGVVATEEDDDSVSVETLSSESENEDSDDDLERQ